MENIFVLEPWLSSFNHFNHVCALSRNQLSLLSLIVPSTFITFIACRLNNWTFQTTSVDTWAAGVILLCIISRTYPFFRAPDDITALVIANIWQSSYSRNIHFEKNNSMFHNWSPWHVFMNSGHDEF